MSQREKYRTIRETARKALQEKINQDNPKWLSKVRLSSIDIDAFNYLDELWVWSNDPEKLVGDLYGWKKTVSRYKTRYARHIDLSLWFGDQLTALLLGKVSRGKAVVNMDFIEGNEDKSPLDGMRLRICVEYAKLVAFEIKASYVVVNNPLPTAIPNYQRLGFSKRKKGNSLELNLISANLVED
jgi:hypothetical protein